jgi:hypothetical protein
MPFDTVRSSGMCLTIGDDSVANVCHFAVAVCAVTVGRSSRHCYVHWSRVQHLVQVPFETRILSCICFFVQLRSRLACRWKRLPSCHPPAHASATKGKSVGRVVRVMVQCLSRVDAGHLAGFHDED